MRVRVTLGPLFSGSSAFHGSVLPTKPLFLRHTAATILLLKNVNPKIVSEMLGHASIAITLDTYSHVLPNMQDSAVEAMEEAFS
jgi:site-specific recombinase XerD